MYTIKNPLKDYLKYPSHSNPIKEPAINTLFNLEKSLEHFIRWENKEKLSLESTEMIQHLYNNYLFDKYE